LTRDLDTLPSGPGRARAEPALPASGLRYHILREYARGGLGEVYLALDEELHREVALKEIQKRHADNPETRARFVLEAEVTGGLEHPGIVPVYGLGQYPDGRPFYAMRLIRGQSLKDAITRFHRDDEEPGRDPGRREVEFRQLLGHFLDVCHAIAYAHARGVIHRDLKPANIMLGAFGETLVVDWGLAKPLDLPPDKADPGLAPLRPLSGSAREGTLYGSTVGTPAYMSPEQAAGRLEDLGPASDVYSLGATLYCLLTGEAPFHGTEIAPLLRRVERGEFPPPRQANRRVPRALEAVCLKAMALRPEDRYGSARVLAEDIERWLADEPVSAYREPWPARAARWARRHKTRVAVAAALLIVATLALAVGTALIDRERARTAANFRLATDAVDALLTQVAAIDLADVPQMEPVRRALLEKAQSFYYEKFLAARRDDPTTRQETGRAFLRLADLRELLGQYPEAVAAYREAIAFFDALAAGEPRRADYRRDLARAQHGLAILLRKSNRFQESERAFRAALKLREALAATSRDDRADYDDTLYHLGALLAKLSRRGPEVDAAYAQAVAQVDALRAADPEKPEYRRKLARYLNNVGILLRPSDRAGAEGDFLKAVEIQRELVRAAPGVAGTRWELARSLNNLGAARQDDRDWPGAAARFSDALDLLGRLAADFPMVPDYRFEQAEALVNLAGVRGGGDRNRTVDDLAEAERLYRGLADEFPLRPDYRHKLAVTLRNRGLALGEAGRSDEAERTLRAAIDGLRRLVEEYPNVPEYEGNLGLALAQLAIFFSRNGETPPRLAEMRAAIEEAIQHQRAVIAASDHDAAYRGYLASALFFRAALDNTEHHYAAMVEAAEEMAGLVPDDPRLKIRAAQYLAHFVGLSRREGSQAGPDPAKDAEYYARKAVRLLREAADRGALSPQALDNKAFRSLDGRPDFEELRKSVQGRGEPAIG
jgi:serine/threonine-protein kinase